MLFKPCETLVHSLYGLLGKAVGDLFCVVPSGGSVNLIIHIYLMHLVSKAVGVIHIADKKSVCIPGKLPCLCRNDISWGESVADQSAC